MSESNGTVKAKRTVRIDVSSSDTFSRRTVVLHAGDEEIHRDLFNPDSKPLCDRFATEAAERAPRGLVEWAARDHLGLADDHFPTEPTKHFTEWIRAEIFRRIERGEKTAENGESPAIEPVTVCLADVQPQPIDWLWPSRIALGKFTMLAGDPGLGKSFATLDIAARVSQGAPWPDDRDTYAPRGGVILLSAEDDVADTIRPRLDAAGADPSKIIAIQAVKCRERGKDSEHFFDLERDLPALEAAIKKQGDTVLVIPDPITAYLGKVKANDNAEVRRVLAPLADLCARHHIACVGVSHLRKGEGQALHRTLGSIAFVAASRAVFVVAKDRTDPKGKRRLFLPCKNNLGNDQTGMAFELSLRHSRNGQPCVLWEPDPISTTADDALATTKPSGRPADEMKAACDFLRSALANGPRPGKEVEEEATKGHGIAQRTLVRARKEIGVRAYRQHVPGPWIWELNSNNAR